jgi:hypothetical protein
MVEQTREQVREQARGAGSDPITRPQTSEDDYSGRDGGTSNAEAVATSQGDGPGDTETMAPERQPAPPEVTRSPTPPEQDPDDR